MRSRGRSLCFLLMILLAILIVAAGCVNQSGTAPAAGGTGGNPSLGTKEGIEGPDNCTSPEQCTAYCSAHHDVCEQYCRDHADICSRFAGTPGPKSAVAAEQGGFGVGTACDTPALKQKMMNEINKILVSPPDTST